MAEPLHSPDVLSPLLAAERLGVLTDVDGTISQIATQPEAAFVSPAAKEALAVLAGRLPVVAALSGRALFDLRAMLNLPDLLYIGSHGLTWWYQGKDELPEGVLPYVAHVQQAAAELADLRALPGLRFEEKGVGVALHYRQATDPLVARAAILDAIGRSPAAALFEVREGIRVVELYPRVAVNKGVALRRVVERFALDGLLFCGDDLTDADAIYAASALRREHGLRAVTVASRHSEAPALIAEIADYVVDGVPGVEGVLVWLAEAVAGRKPADAGPSPPAPDPSAS